MTMIARVAAFEGVDVEAAERTMAEAEAVIRPLVEGLAGYRGHLELVADSGKVLSITLFASGADADAAEETFDEELPRRLGDLFGSFAGRRVSVDRYRTVAASLS
jgi:hypothetical protein